MDRRGVEPRPAGCKPAVLPLSLATHFGGAYECRSRFVSPDKRVHIRPAHAPPEWSASRDLNSDCAVFETAASAVGLDADGRPGGIRTHKWRLLRPLDTPFSYGPMVGATGIEPAVSSLRARLIAFDDSHPWSFSWGSNPNLSLTKALRAPSTPEKRLERIRGLEPRSLAWKAKALPLDDTRVGGVGRN